jgi:hypothetical protein
MLGSGKSVVLLMFLNFRENIKYCHENLCEKLFNQNNFIKMVSFLMLLTGFVFFVRNLRNLNFSQDFRDFFVVIFVYFRHSRRSVIVNKYITG